jgi:hypothetical protein
MLRLRRLEGRTSRSTHCHMRHLPKKIKPTPARLAPLRSRPYPFRALHPLPQRTNARRSPLPGAPNACRSDNPLPHPGKIHGGGAAVLQGSGRLSATPGDRALPSSSTVVAEPSLILVALVVLVLVRRRSPPALTPTARIDQPRLSLPYVANVCSRCFSRFKGMLQLILMDVAKVDRRCCTCRIY